MIRVMTPKGIVDVTDDHSLLTKEGQEISPKDVKIGMELLHFDLPCPKVEMESLSIDEARIMGFFFGCGRCNNKSDWILRNACPNTTQQYLELCQSTYKSFGWTSMDTNSYRSYGKKKSKVEYDIILFSFNQTDYSYKCKFIQNYYFKHIQYNLIKK
jgi:hypothetical protein